MSKSLGNYVLPQDSHQGKRRRDPPTVGRDGGLPRGVSRRQADSRPSRRSVSEDPQHAAYLVANLYDFDPARGSLSVSTTAGGRPVHPRAIRRDGEPDAPRLRRGRLPDDLPGAERVHDGGPERLYADVSKDRLYTFAAASPERRSAQTAMYTSSPTASPGSCAPVLPMTADESAARSCRALAKRIDPLGGCFRGTSSSDGSSTGPAGSMGPADADREAVNREIEPVRTPR